MADNQRWNGISSLCMLEMVSKAPFRGKNFHFGGARSSKKLSDIDVLVKTYQLMCFLWEAERVTFSSKFHNFR
jgi:hypothetical protein